MLTGTSHFRSRTAAIDYYLDYEENYATAAKEVDRKIADGEIHIGRPDLKPGQRLTLIDSGNRYAIED